jgi:hypothetical protein
MDAIHVQYSRDVIEEIPKEFHGPLEEGHAFARTKHVHGRDYLMFKDCKDAFITQETLDNAVKNDIEIFKSCQLVLHAEAMKEMMTYDDRTEEIVCVEHYIHIVGILNLIFGKSIGTSIYAALCKKNGEKWIDYKKMKSFVFDIIKRIKYYSIGIEEDVAHEKADAFFKLNQLPETIKRKIKKEKEEHARGLIRKHFAQLFEEIYSFKRSQYDSTIDFDAEELRRILHETTDTCVDHIKNTRQSTELIDDNDNEFNDYVSKTFPHWFFKNEVNNYFMHHYGDDKAVILKPYRGDKRFYIKK